MLASELLNFNMISEIAIYLRKSRGDEEKDLKKHREMLTEIAKKNKWKYVIYEEIGSAETIEYRPQMVKLLEDIEKGLYDGVLVVDYDRLGRGDKQDQAIIERTFSNSKTLIITPQKVYNLENENDVLLSDVQGLLARFEYKQIKKRLYRGKLQGAKLGNWTNGPAPFPYKYNQDVKSLEIDESKINLYMEIKERVLSGEPLYIIAEDLNCRGYRTNRNKIWTDTAIHRIMLNEVHLGRVIIGKTSGSGHKNRQSKPLKSNPRSEWIVFENAHPAVITIEEYNKVQEIFHRNRMIAKKARKGMYPLSGLLKCGKCSSSMSFTSKLYKDADFITLKKCQKSDGFGHRCGNAGIKQDIILEILKDRLSDFEENLVKQQDELISTQSEKLKIQLIDSTNELEKMKNALDRVKDLYELGEYSREEFLERRENWQKKIDNKLKDTEKLKSQLQYYQTISTEDRLKHLRNLDSLWDSIYDENLKLNEDGVKHLNRALKQIINKITYVRNNNEIEIKIEFL